MKTRCPGCQAAFNVAADSVGKSGKCPKYGARVTVPEAPKKAAKETKKGRPPSARQKEYADALGISYTADVTFAQLSALIDQAVEKEREGQRLLAQASPGEICAELAERGFWPIL